METREIQGTKISRLGMGCMRLPLTAPGGDIDEKKTRELFGYLMDRGVSYFDTAYSYHGGKSETVTGKLLKEFPREKWLLASKMPGHERIPDLDPAEIFEKQLKKCQTEYFDFYLLHNVHEASLPVYLDRELGIVDYLLKQKALGRIKHLGFSAHATVEKLESFLDAYPGVFEFTQIQLNYLDWTLQRGGEKYRLLTERKLPIFVMEPLRGGKLASLSTENRQKLNALRPGVSPAEWSFRFLESLPNVAMVLSGMNELSQAKENCDVFSSPRPVTEGEKEALFSIAESMKADIPCTGCRYCCKNCPMELDIPRLLRLYQDCRYDAGITVAMSLMDLPPEKRASSCVGCCRCMQACPQNIDIPTLLKAFAWKEETIPDWAEICRQRAEAAKRS